MIFISNDKMKRVLNIHLSLEIAINIYILFNNPCVFIKMSNKEDKLRNHFAISIIDKL